MRNKWGALVLVLGALASGGLVSWIASAGDLALGDTVTGTTGDITFSATWVTGPNSNQTTLTIAVASSSADPISDFRFDVNGSGFAFTDGGGCSIQSDETSLECPNFIDKGKSAQLTFTTNSSLSPGLTGTLTFRDNAEADQPPVTISLQSPGTTSTGGGTTSTGGGTTSTGGGTTTAPAVCDWTVAFAHPPAVAPVGGRVPYEIVVTNRGTATCPSTAVTETMNSDTSVGREMVFGGPGRRRVSETVPSLGPGASASSSVEVSPLSAMFIGNNSTGRLTVTATLPVDADGLPSDETASASTEFTISGPTTTGVDVKSNGKGTLPADCGVTAGGVCHDTGAITTESCTTGPGPFCTNDQPAVCPAGGGPGCSQSPFMSCTSGPGGSCGLAADRAARSTIGTISGSIAGGKHGKISITVNAAGKRLLRTHHTLHERLVLTVGGGAASSTVAYPITLKLRG